MFVKWYVDSSLAPEIKSIIQNMSQALTNQKKISLEIVSREDSLLSRFMRSVSGDLLHIFGDAPLMKLHSKIVQTVFDEDRSKKLLSFGKGNITLSRFFLIDARDGDEIILPNFGSLSLSLSSQEIKRGIFTNGTMNLPENISAIDISGKITRSEALDGIYVASETNQLEAFRAGILTMRGVSIASRKSEYLDEIIGSENYFVIPQELEPENFREILDSGLSDKGRKLATSARHYVNENHSEKNCADSLLGLYEKVMRN